MTAANEDVQTRAKELERVISQLEITHGKESVEVAEALQEFAKYLKLEKFRLLDAANMEARAGVIKAKTSSSPEGSTTTNEANTVEHYRAELVNLLSKPGNALATVLEVLSRMENCAKRENQKEDAAKLGQWAIQLQFGTVASKRKTLGVIRSYLNKSELLI